MAIIHLDDYDILDLLPTAGFPPSVQEDQAVQLLDAYQQYFLTLAMKKLSEPDQLELEMMMGDEDTTYEDIQQFFHEKFGNYDEFLELVALDFKRMYLMNVYRSMLEEAKGKNDETVSLWEQAIQLGEADNWDAVKAVIRDIEDIYFKQEEPQELPPQQPIPAN